MKTISQEWREYEARTGKKVSIEKAYPVIGRGTVVHDWIPHAEVEERFNRALRIPFFTRAKWSIERRLSHV